MKQKKQIFGKIITIEYDLNCNANICSTHFGDGEKQYSLHPSTMRKETEKRKEMGSHSVIANL
jgi:ribosomal protein L2